MSKELEVINDLRDYLNFIKTEQFSKTNLIRYFNEKLDIIEKALERNKELEETLKRYDIFSVYELKDRLNRLKDIEKSIKKIFPNNEYTFGLLVDKIRNIELQEKTDEALEIIKEWFDFDFAIRFGDNQPIVMITNKRTGQYWELPETTEICDLLKEVLL